MDRAQTLLTLVLLLFLLPVSFLVVRATLGILNTAYALLYTLFHTIIYMIALCIDLTKKEGSGESLPTYMLWTGWREGAPPPGMATQTFLHIDKRRNRWVSAWRAARK